MRSLVVFSLLSMRFSNISWEYVFFRKRGGGGALGAFTLQGAQGTQGKVGRGGGGEDG